MVQSIQRPSEFTWVLNDLSQQFTKASAEWKKQIQKVLLLIFWNLQDKPAAAL